MVAHVTITPERDITSPTTAPLVAIDCGDANKHNETEFQLRESETYEYKVEALVGQDLRLRCSLARRRRSLIPGDPDAGRIDTSCWCGTLHLEVVEGDVQDITSAVGATHIDVRSVKLEYRTEYRGMLRRVADEVAGLVADARSSAKTNFRSSFEERRDAGWMQIQLELLREVLESAEFAAALHRLITFPHERLAVEIRDVATNRRIKWTSAASRQLISRFPRRDLPVPHPLGRTLHVDSIAAVVSLSEKKCDLDTPENRFIKFALQDFRSFLSRSQEVFEAQSAWRAVAGICQRLLSILDEALSRQFFQTVGEFRYVPLGSPVLQGKAGYRELLRWWLRFRTAAEVSWRGGEEMFRAGQRDVAQLYEYWLFFELLSWFCRKCCRQSRPAADDLLEGLDGSTPNLRLRETNTTGTFSRNHYHFVAAA